MCKLFEKTEAINKHFAALKYSCPLLQKCTRGSIRSKLEQKPIDTFESWFSPES